MDARLTYEEVLAELKSCADAGGNDVWRAMINDCIHQHRPMPKVAQPLRYVSSVDDAMTLIPQRFTSSVDATAPELLIDWVLYEPGKNGREFTGTAHSMALACCIAAYEAWCAVS